MKERKPIFLMWTKWRAEEKNKKSTTQQTKKKCKKHKRILHWYYYSDIMVYHCDVRRFFILFIRCVLIIASLLNFVSSSIQPLERPILWLIWLCCGFLSLSLSFSLSLQYVFFVCVPVPFAWFWLQKRRILLICGSRYFRPVIEYSAFFSALLLNWRNL